MLFAAALVVIVGALVASVWLFATPDAGSRRWPARQGVRSLRAGAPGHRLLDRRPLRRGPHLPHHSASRRLRTLVSASGGGPPAPRAARASQSARSGSSPSAPSPWSPVSGSRHRSHDTLGTPTPASRPFSAAGTTRTPHHTGRRRHGCRPHHDATATTDRLHPRRARPLISVTRRALTCALESAQRSRRALLTAGVVVFSPNELTQAKPPSRTRAGRASTTSTFLALLARQGIPPGGAPRISTPSSRPLPISDRASARRCRPVATIKLAAMSSMRLPKGPRRSTAHAGKIESG